MTRKIRRSASWERAGRILFWGALWGLFEATAGFLLHLAPFPIGAYVWFPAAYIFMERAYRFGGKRDVVYVAWLSAAIKLLNLLTPTRLDYVVNPAISIVLESMAMVCLLWFENRPASRRIALPLPVRVLCVNTLWRSLYTLYCLAAPAWIRQASVVQSAGAYVSFILVENVLSAAVCASVLWAFGKLPVAMSGAQNPLTK